MGSTLTLCLCSTKLCKLPNLPLPQFPHPLKGGYEGPFLRERIKVRQVAQMVKNPSTMRETQV